ncbi:hypothetical protein [Chryseobacterium sp. Mn2064]|uniref:hypothetical protein n=1 Tax=Chryseobacterium sp. Mn2064 TaxID=3395263 RepID=UPI003BC4A4BF
MKIKYMIVFCITASIVSCNQKERKVIDKGTESEKTFKINDTKSDSLKILLNNIIKKGDTLSYNKAYKTFTVYGDKREFLYYSMMMADKYNYKRAFYNTYMLIQSIGIEYEYDTKSKIGEYYLLKAYEMEDKFAIQDVEYIYKGKLIPTSSSVLEK